MHSGFTLALTENPLSSEPAGAWQYGPVFPSVWSAFKSSIEKKECSENENFSNNEKAIMKEVFKKYGKHKAWILSQLTHAEGSPWDKTLKNGRSEIDNDEIKKHYKEKLNI